MEAARTQPAVDAAPISPQQARALVEQAYGSISAVLKGQSHVVRVVLAAVLARGHVLLEDVPGVGKTTLARAVAKALGNSFARIQFTADMLPTDVLGVQVLDTQTNDFTLRKGPLFSQVVLADEINRASPKTQSAMLEAMSEAAVTIDDQTYALPEPFFVIATQNPIEHHGAYPLPESQLDRFAVGLSLGYPAWDDERALLSDPHEPTGALAELHEILDAPRLKTIQAVVDDVRLSDPVADYLLGCVRATREHSDVVLGCSTRGTMVFGAMVRAWAFLDGRDYVLPDDVKILAPAVLGHRLVVASGSGSRRTAAHAIVEEILGQVSVPR